MLVRALVLEPKVPVHHQRSSPVSQGRTSYAVYRLLVQKIRCRFSVSAGALLVQWLGDLAWAVSEPMELGSGRLAVDGSFVRLLVLRRHAGLGLVGNVGRKAVLWQGVGLVVAHLHDGMAVGLDKVVCLGTGLWHWDACPG